jgi:branched-chain amino acid transport system permease protein
MSNHRTSHRIVSNGLIIITLIALIAFPLLGNDFYNEILGKIFILSIFALSLQLLVGVTGLVSLGHAAYFGIASYAVALMTPKTNALSIFLTLPAAMLFSALAAFVVGLFVLRTKGIYFIMVTLAFSQLVFYVFHDTDFGGGSDGIYLDHKPRVSLGDLTLIDLSAPGRIYYILLGLLILVYFFLKVILKSPFGKVLQGIKSNEQRMLSMGYSTFKYKLAAFTLAGGLAGLAGYWHAVLFGFVTPELMSWHQSGNVLLMVILGGMGHLGGAIAGAVAFVGMQELFTELTKHWQLLMGGVIVLAVLFMPGGIMAVPGRVGNLIYGRNQND